MNNRIRVTLLSAVLIAAVASGLRAEISDYGIAADQTPVQFRNPFGI